MSKFATSRCALMLLNITVIVLSLAMLLVIHLYAKNRRDLKNIPLGELIEWIGDLASRIDYKEENYSDHYPAEAENLTSSWWASTKCLISVSILGYFLALCGLVAVGLEHLSLLITLSMAHFLIFGATLSGLIFAPLSAGQWSFGCSTLVTIFGISTLQVSS